MKVTICTCKARFPFEPFQREYLNGCPKCHPDVWRDELERAKQANVDVTPYEKLTWAEVEPFLQAVSRGEIKLTVDGISPADMYCGTVKYNASNGWTVKVFNDCDEFDYIDDVSDASGKYMDFHDLYWQYEEVYEARRNNEDEVERLDAEKYHPGEFDEAALALWHWS